MDREEVRLIIREICGYHPATQFVRDDGTVQLLVPGGATPEQILLIATYRREILEYLTTPPPVSGECWRGHTIQWVCTSGGTWLCACYYSAMDEINRRSLKADNNAKKVARSLAEFWTQQSETPATSSK